MSSIQMRFLAYCSLALLVLAASVSESTADPLPEAWQKTMTSDPETNYVLKKFSEPLADGMVTVARSIMLFRLLSSTCKGVVYDKKIINNDVEASGFSRLRTDKAKEVSQTADALFNYFDYEAFAHLCAGSDYLFGPKGVLVRNAMSKGSGELIIPYESKNPYLTVRPLLRD